jgi:murein DD-endopeptidase MepM/ murein hydrolase activator NlpD
MTPPLPYIPSAAIAQAFIVALGMVCNDHSVAQVPEPVLGEVVEATVFCGDDRLFEEGAPMSTDELEWLLDSLCALPEAQHELVRDLELYHRIRTMDEADMLQLIDPLFELEEVPYALINEVTRYAEERPTDEEVEHSATVGWELDGPFPGSSLYGVWRTDGPNVHGPELSANDSMVLLDLTRPDHGCGSHRPVPGVLTSRYGWRDGRAHNGIDLDLRTGEPVRSMFPGVVHYAGTHGSYGRLVVVRHYNGLETYYAHLHRLKVTPGTEVDAGDLLGTGGSTGRSTGPHLHLEVRFKGSPIDPLRFFDPGTGELTCNTLVLKRTRWSFAAYPHGTRTHVVRHGEYLQVIAQHYGTSVEELCQLNGITRRTRLTVGQELAACAENLP